jgi:hypothetical protein
MRGADPLGGRNGAELNAPTTAAGADTEALISARDVELIRLVATNVWESVDDFSVVFAKTLHERIPELGGPEDATAAEVTRRSSIGSMHEFLSIMRAGIFAPNAIETATEALEHVRYLQNRGIGLGLALRWYHVGVAMFEPMVIDQFEHDAPDNATLERMRGLIRQFIFIYVDQITKRLAAEYGVTEREGWVGDPDAPVLHDPALAEVTRNFLSGRQRDGNATAAHRHSEEALGRFCAAMETAAADPNLSRKLARAGTTVRITLADDPDLGVTLLLDRTPIQVVDNTAAAVELSIASVDLDRLCSPEFHLAMAIARGRVQYQGAVRKFLRVTPIVRHASLPTRAATDSTLTAST